MNNIHIDERPGTGWTVRRFDGEARIDFGNFHVRAHAEAFGRAIAHRNRVELFIHPVDGSVTRVKASELSYPML